MIFGSKILSCINLGFQKEETESKMKVSNLGIVKHLEHCIYFAAVMNFIKKALKLKNSPKYKVLK